MPPRVPRIPVVSPNPIIAPDTPGLAPENPPKDASMIILTRVSVATFSGLGAGNGPGRWDQGHSRGG